MDDQINNPSHYNTGGMECIEAQTAALTYEEMQGYLKATALKYLWRMGKKGPALTDAKKAQWFTDRLVVLLGTRVPTASAGGLGSVDEGIEPETKEWLEQCNMIGEREAMMDEMVQTAAEFDPGDAPDPAWNEDYVRKMDKIRGKLPWHQTIEETRDAK